MKIIGECAINWDGIDEAKNLIKDCKEAGLWAAKFQMYNKSNIVNPEHYDICMEHMLDCEEAEELFLYGKQIGIEVFFTPMYEAAIPILERIGVNFYKIRYFDNQNLSLRMKISETNKPCFVSVGKREYHFKNELFLYCIPDYPASYTQYDWKAYHYRNMSGTSDHTSDLRLLKEELYYNKREYFEKHVRLRDGFIEDKWSVKISDIREVLKND